MAEDFAGLVHDALARWRCNRLNREHDNCRAALTWCQAQGYGEPAPRLAVALARLKAAGVNHARAPLYARALVAAGRLAAVQGDLPAARSLHEQALRTFEEHGDTAGMYSALSGLGV